MRKVMKKPIRNLLRFRKMCFFLLISLLLIPADGYFAKESKALSAVFATVETIPVLNPPDSADDVAIWIHPTNPSLSTIIGSDKGGNLEVYDLTGAVLQRISFRPNNIDLRYNFPLGTERVTLVTGIDRNAHRIFAYKVNPQTRLLEDVSSAQPYLNGFIGSTMYVSPVTGKYYVFTNYENVLKQYELRDNGIGQVAVSLVRTVTFGSFVNLTEGITADDIHAKVYVSEEAVAIWKLGAEPTDGSAKVMVDKPIDQGGHFKPDIEGLTIYYKANGTGYLIGSSQGNSTFTVYTREGNNGYLGTFNIGDGGIDGVNGTDGIDVTNFPLGPNFPSGVFIAQDGGNTDGNVAKNQNFKLVPFQSIAGALNLTMDTSWDPRLVGAGFPPPPRCPSSTVGGTPNVEVHVAGALLKSHYVPPGQSISNCYGINGGPMRVRSTNGLPIFTSQRAIYGSSFNSIVGYPANQLTTDYWFTSYDDVGMTTYLVIGNPSASTALVDVYIGGVKRNATPYSIAPGQRIFPRYGVNSGPVHVVSTNGIPIFTSERTKYMNSFNEVMGYPGNQLTTDYWFTSYDDTGMITYLVIGNPSASTALVDVYIGGVKRNATPYSIAPGKRISQRYNLNSGPVRVVSTNGVGIFTSERSKFGQSFNEIMGYPGNRLTTDYWFTSYDDVGMITYLVIGNPHPSNTAQVDVYIGGVKRNATPYSIAPGQRVFLRYQINKGPVHVVSTNGVAVFTSERSKYLSSFNEILGLANNQLTTDYWFTSYDDRGMITALVVAIP